jgi:serine/threonine protein kinase/Flp pilus assembly protein TadD
MGSIFMGRYKIVEELGRGGMGAVYKALDSQINEEVAIKLIRPDIASDEKTLERFANELKLARKISHKNVCRMYHLEKGEETPYISMEYLEGKDLKKLIWEKEKLPVEEAIGIAQQVCEGLTEAHRLGVVHRDLKPQNIMIDKDGQAKIMDFGIARSVEAPGVTQTGVIIGTPDYISPEQAEGMEADERADIYSLGVILYEMVTGSVPFKGDTALSVALKHKALLPLDPRKRNPEIPDDLSRLILICMEKDRNRRYQTVKDLLEDLRNIEHGLPLGTKIRPHRGNFVSSLVRKKLFVPTLILILSIVALAVWKFRPHEEIVAAPKIENSIAVVSFRNDTGDESNDRLSQRVLPSALSTILENSGLFAYAPSKERMDDLLNSLRKKETEFIDTSTGIELCRRLGVKTLVTGSLNQVGEAYNMILRILDVENGKSFASFMSESGSKESLLGAQINEMGLKICEEMGGNLEKIGKDRLNIAGVTTSSLEAYQHYLDGIDFFWKWRFDEARDEFRKAIEIDPSFASAYRWLCAGSLLPREEKREAITKALELSSQATEKERMYIQARAAAILEGNSKKFIKIHEDILEKYPQEKLAHFMIGNRLHIMYGDFERAFQEYEAAVKLDPNFSEAVNSLGILYFYKREFEKSLELLKRSFSLSQGNANPPDTIGELYFKWGKLKKAVDWREKAVKMDPDLYQVYWALAYTEALRENYNEALAWIDRLLERDPPLRFLINALYYRGFLNLWTAQFEQSLQDFRKAAELQENEIGLDYWKPIVYLEQGDYESSRECFESYFEGQIRRYPDYVNGNKIVRAFFLGWIDMKERNLTSATARLEEMKSLLQSDETKAIWIRVPHRQNFHNYLFDIIDCKVRFNEGKADVEKILESLSGDWWPYKDEQYNLWDVGFVIRHLNFPPFVRDFVPRAYLQEGELDKAIEAYEKLVAFNPESIDRRLIHPLNYYRLGKVYEQKGNKRKAKSNYRKFLKLWKDADPGIAEVEDAKKRLVEL